jgi:hypothetical protein
MEQTGGQSNSDKLHELAENVAAVIVLRALLEVLS